MYAPLKKKFVRANEVTYMSKAPKKAFADRSRLENQYYKNRSDERLRAYKKQKNVCNRLYRKERKLYYTNLNPKEITDSRKFWKTVKHFLSDRGAGKTGIILVEGDEIIQGDSEVAKVLSDFFSSAVKSLDVEIPSEYLEESVVSDDTIDKIIHKYSNHPSIKLITDNVIKGKFPFSEVTLSDVQKVVAALDSKKASLCNNIPTKILKENCNVCCEPQRK